MESVDATRSTSESTDLSAWLLPMICSRPRLAGLDLSVESLAKGVMVGELKACSTGNGDDSALMEMRKVLK